MERDIEKLLNILGHAVRLNGLCHIFDVPVSHTDVQMLFKGQILQGPGETAVRLLICVTGGAS